MCVCVSECECECEWIRERWDYRVCVCTISECLIRVGGSFSPIPLRQLNFSSFLSPQSNLFLLFLLLFSSSSSILFCSSPSFFPLFPFLFFFWSLIKSIHPSFYLVTILSFPSLSAQTLLATEKKQ